MSNYPPGVTGFEPQIAGPLFERDEAREVGACTENECSFEGGEVAGTLSGDHALATFWWECPEGHENETEIVFDPDDYGPDPDYDPADDWD